MGILKAIPAHLYITHASEENASDNSCCACCGRGIH